MDVTVSVKKKNRVLPLKMELLDEGGFAVTDLDLIALPLVEVDFTGGDPTEPPSAELLFAAQGDNGNQFAFTDDFKWQFNLRARNFSGDGAYTITAVSGDPEEYVIDPTCTAEFVIE